MSSHSLKSGVQYASPDGIVLAIDADDPWQVHMLAGLFSPLIVSVVKAYAKPGSTAIDGGAHLGYISLSMAQSVGPHGTVHSFECDPRMATRLRNHIEWNHATNVHAHEIALTDGDEPSIDFTLAEQVGWSSAASSLPVPILGTVHVLTTSVDKFIAANELDPTTISLVKLDIEGCEIPAIFGMKHLLGAGNPGVLVEWIPERLELQGYSPTSLPDFLTQLGYRAWLPVWTPRLGNYDAFRLDEYEFNSNTLVDLLLLKD
jgi:FkbM family methyltransferase